MLEQSRLRFLLADDAGAGKTTIMSGLYIREMLSRRLLQRILIVVPAGLVGNWQHELLVLFNLPFQILSGNDARYQNPFIGDKSDRVIISVDTLSSNRVFARLKETEVMPYDLVIFDEAHKLSADRGTDMRVRKTSRYRLAEALAGVNIHNEHWRLGWSAHHLLLLTATPHMGKDYPCPVEHLLLLKGGRGIPAPAHRLAVEANEKKELACAFLAERVAREMAPERKKRLLENLPERERFIRQRIATAELISTDPFLSRHCKAVLFERLPASTLSTQAGYMTALDSPDVYLGIIGFEYGTPGQDGFSAMHREYLRASHRRIPMVIFVKGQSGRDKERNEKMQDLFARIRDPQARHTYRRFTNYQNLKHLAHDALLPILKKRGLSPSNDEQTEFEQTLSAASDFDIQLLNQVDIKDLDPDLVRQYVIAVLNETPKGQPAIQRTLLSRGLLWYDEKHNRHRPTSAGLLLFGKAPDAIFPQCRIAANAYGGTEKGEAIDRRDIRQSLPKAVQEGIAFLIRNMRHTQTVRGFARVELDEYPYEALREVLINAVAHRDYRISGASIRIEKYADRIVILSPGLPPPEFSITDGHFTVIFRGPGKSMAKLKAQKARPLFAVEPTIIDLLTSNQKTIMRELLKKGEVQVSKIAARLKVTEQAVRKDMAKLQKMGLVEKRGAARATYYVLRERQVTP